MTYGLLYDDLRLEGRVLDLIRALNELRKDAGLELTDRIRVWLPRSAQAVLPYADRIKDEVLAVSLELDGEAAQPRIERA